MTDKTGVELIAEERQRQIFSDGVSGLKKPTPDDRIKELVKAGALIAAEIDRLKRLEK